MKGIFSFLALAVLLALSNMNPVSAQDKGIKSNDFIAMANSAMGKSYDDVNALLNNVNYGQVDRTKDFITIKGEEQNLTFSFTGGYCDNVELMSSKLQGAEANSLYETLRSQLSSNGYKLSEANGVLSGGNDKLKAFVVKKADNDMASVDIAIVPQF